MDPKSQSTAIPSQRRGFSLIEIMLALTLFSMLAMAIIAGVLQVRRMAENAVYQNAAITAATGYLEQMKGMEYQTLVDSIEDVSLAGLIPTRIDQGVADYLYNNQRDYRKILIDTDEAGNVESTMDMYFTPRLTNLFATNGLRTVQIELEFEWLDPHTRSLQSRVLKNVRSNVSSL
jgi:prepilin-type N-terminal cleavage/methylation domain-containing protein